MYEILIRFLIISALLDLGMTLTKLNKCENLVCLNQLQEATNKVLHIDWQPISVFPEEAKRFKKQE